MGLRLKIIGNENLYVRNNFVQHTLYEVIRNTEIASVDENTGKVTTLTSGSVSIRATSIANDAIYDEASIEIEKFVEPTVSFDIDSKYVPGNFIVGGSMEVSCNYHAGNFATVKDGIKFWLRELNPKWTVIKETYIV